MSNNDFDVISESTIGESAIESIIGESRSLGGASVAYVLIIDESSEYWLNVENYAPDLARFRNLRDQARPGIGLCVLDVPAEFSPDLIIPFDETFPADINIVEAAVRPQTLADQIAAFDLARGGEDPDSVVLIVDDSGSLLEPDVEQAIDEFRNWLDARIPRAVRSEILFDDERWLEAFNRVLVS